MAETTKEPEEEKKSSKKLIFIIAGVLLLVVIGAGAYFFMSGSSEATEPEEEGKQTEGSEPPKDAFYFDMIPPFVTNFPKEKDEKLFQVSIALLANNEATLEAIKKHEPRVRNNFLLVLTSQDLQHLKTTEGKAQLRKSLKEELVIILKESHQDQGLDEVFFTSFVMQ